jgi:hypothetical protein
MFTADKSKIGSNFPHSPNVGDYFFKISTMLPDRVSLIGSWWRFELAGGMFRWILEDGLEWVYTPGGSPEFRQHRPKEW